MFVKKTYNIISFIIWSAHHFTWLLPLVILVTLGNAYLDWTWLSIPWQPIAVIGTAVAFYIGFKNNQAYDRIWEARKIWGSIVNSSRAWGSYVKGFVSNQFNKDISEEEVSEIQKKLIYRHIGWLYTLRSQLLIPEQWEHIRQTNMVGKFAERRQRKFGTGLFADEISQTELKHYLPKDEYDRLINYKNTATQIIDQQSENLKEIRNQCVIEDFRHMELQKVLYDFYIHQGKLERIKKFPLPRQYANTSFIFVGIFIFFLPFGLAPLFNLATLTGIISAIITTTMVAWVYLIMELIGDYSENPFEGAPNDTPMLALCRTIEIDLKEMLNDKNIPDSVIAKKNVLM